MRSICAAALAVLLSLASPCTAVAAEAPPAPAVGEAVAAGPEATLARLRGEVDAASARGETDGAIRALLAETLAAALSAHDLDTAVTIGARSLAAARDGGTAAELATALGDHASALDAAGRGAEAAALRVEALALIDRRGAEIPLLDRIVFRSNLATAAAKAGDVRAATDHALAAADLLLGADLPREAAGRWTRTLLVHGRAATAAKDPKARDLRIATVRFASRTGIGEPGSALKNALADAVAICETRPELARDLLLDVIDGPAFAPWLAANRVTFIETLDMAGAKWGLAGSMASSGEDGRRIRGPLLDVLEAAVARLTAPDGGLPPQAEMLLRRALYTGSITRRYDRAEKAGLRAIALLKAQPKLDAAALADAHATLGELYQDTGRPAEARALLTDAVDTARRTGARNALIAALSSLASIERNLGTPASVAAAYGTLLAELDPRGIARERDGDPLTALLARRQGVEAAHAWVARSIALEELGRVDEAEFGYRRSLEISKRAGDTSTFAINAVYLVQHHRHFGRLAEANALADDAIAAVGRDMSPTALLSMKADVLVSLARPLPPGDERTRSLAEAGEFLALAERRREEAAADLVEMERADDLRLSAEIERMSGRPEKAAVLVDTLIEHERAITPPRPARLSLVLLDRAVLAIESGRAEAALRDLAEAESLAPVPKGDALSAGARASILAIRSQAAARLNRPADALATARQAADLARIVVTAADGGATSSSEDARKTTAGIFHNAMRAAWRSRP